MNGGKGGGMKKIAQMNWKMRIDFFNRCITIFIHEYKITRLTSAKQASVVQWYDESLPSIRPGFDSPLMQASFTSPNVRVYSFECLSVCLLLFSPSCPPALTLSCIRAFLVSVLGGLWCFLVHAERMLLQHSKKHPKGTKALK